MNSVLVCMTYSPMLDTIVESLQKNGFPVKGERYTDKTLTTLRQERQNILLLDCEANMEATKANFEAWEKGALHVSIRDLVAEAHKTGTQVFLANWEFGLKKHLVDNELLRECGEINLDHRGVLSEIIAFCHQGEGATKRETAR